ncbi:MAG: carboxylating nicotinate-nucleotide diphosphorylase [Alphaproteobacteria bacterium]|nr:carboxylating nicotinate-nucleotide diphosphorylase [Alphaproteobacteria bacterium]
MSELNVAPAHIPPLPDVVLEPIVRLALLEDLGRGGDITSDAVLDPDAPMSALVRSRQEGCSAGYDAARLALRLIDPSASWISLQPEGVSFRAGAGLVRLEGRASSLLACERVALNFMGRLSGVASLTQAYVRAVDGYRARIVCTRKTTPGHRALEKRAVRLGGGVNHRLGLDDAILIKDNHIAAAGGVRQALERARAHVGHLRAVEIEVDTLDQLEEVLATPPDAVLLDNMSPETLERAVAMTAGRCKTEASGGVTLDTVRRIAAAGVDFISVGALTHSAPCLDLGLDID